MQQPTLRGLDVLDATHPVARAGRRAVRSASLVAPAAMTGVAGCVALVLHGRPAAAFAIVSAAVTFALIVRALLARAELREAAVGAIAAGDRDDGVREVADAQRLLAGPAYRGRLARELELGAAPLDARRRKAIGVVCELLREPSPPPARAVALCAALVADETRWPPLADDADALDVELRRIRYLAAPTIDPVDGR